MTAWRTGLHALFVAVGVLVAVAGPRAHDGPPFPILFNRVAGPYEISIWTDPDATDDGTAGGQFWVVLRAAPARADLPGTTRATVAVRPLGRPGTEQVVPARPVEGRVDRQFAALRMDHEGRFAVRVTVDGPLGRAEVVSEVDATYDLRPPPLLLGVYLLPFLALGAFWIKLLRRRAQARAASHGAPADTGRPGCGGQ